MPDYKINIITEADNTGAQQAAQGLDDLGKSTGKAGDKAEGFNVHNREMRRLFGELNRIAPGLGEALHAVFNPSMAGLAGTLILVEALVRKFDEWKKKQEEAAATAGALWEAQYEGVRKAAEGAAAYAEALNKTDSALEKLNKQYTAESAILQAQAEAHKKILDALEKEELAAAKGDKEKEEEIRRRYDSVRRVNDLANEQQEIARLATEKRALEKLRDEARQKADAADAEKESAQTKPEAVTKAESFLNANQKDYEKAQLSIDKNGGIEAQKKQVEAIRAAHGGELTVFGQDLQDQIDIVEKYHAAKKTIDDWSDHVAKIEKTAKETLAAWEALNKQVGEVSGKITTGSSVMHEHAAGDDISQAIGLSRRAAAGEKLSPQEEYYVRSVGTLIAGQNVSLSQAEAMFNNASNNQKMLDTFLKRLMGALDKMPDFASYQTRLEALEKKFGDTSSQIKSFRNK